MLIPLSEWASSYFKAPPCAATLRKIASTGQTDPPAQFIARRWYVDEKAVFVGIVTSAHIEPVNELMRKVINGRIKKVEHRGS